MTLSKIIVGALIKSLVGAVCHAKSKPAPVATESGAQQTAIAGKIDLNSAKSKLAEFLPGVIDKLTPDGTISEGSLLDKGMEFLKGKLA